MFNDLLLVPHVYGKTDCWWLVREVFRRYGIDIPEYNVARAAVAAANYDLGYFSEVVNEHVNKDWEPIEVPEEPCLITMMIDIQSYHHVAVYVGNNEFLHSSSMRHYVTRENLDNPIYARRNFYRYCKSGS